MKQIFALALGLLLVGAASAQAQDVKYNFDKQANFAAFKTYKWVAIKGAQPINDIVDKQIKAAIDKELATKGLTKTEADTADLYIGYQAAVDTEKQYTSYSSGWGYGPGWYGGGWYGAGGMQTTTGSDVNDLCGPAGGGHVLDRGKDPGLARERHQDARRQGQAGQAGKEPRESDDQAVQELPAATRQEEVAISRRGPDRVGFPPVRPGDNLRSPRSSARRAPRYHNIVRAIHSKSL